MSSPVRLASFCRLCLTKTKDKVSIFAEGDMLGNLLHLIEIQIDQNDEPDAVVCYDCVVTLEGFHQFKEQCHVNDEFVRTVPVKRDSSASSAEMGLVAGEEEDEDNPDEEALEENKLEEDDHLELSEAEEVFQERPRRKAAPKFNKKKKAGKRPKKSPVQKPVKKQIAKVTTIKKPKEEPSTSPKACTTLDELQVLADSYPDFFYFEKGARSIYYTIIFYGERYNSALFTDRNTYWQCIHRRKYRCTAQLVVTNDYKTFERRYEHTHGQLPEKEGQAFTPHEALPELFQICKRIVLQKRAKNVKQNSSFEGAFQEFAKETKIENTNDDEPDEPVSPINESKSTVHDSDEEVEVASESRPKRKIKPNARFEQTQPKKQCIESEAKSKKQAVVKGEPKKLQAGEKPKSRLAEKREREIQEEMDSSESEDDATEEDEEEEEELDLDKIEAECEAFKVPKKPPSGPPLDEQLVVADSYPDYFFFEKGPRSIYFTLVYYGERYHSAMFTEHYTYWQCRHRRKYKCPAQVCVSNDYKMFERRYEHTHPDLPDKEGEAFTPKEALPDLFEACRKVVLRNRAKRRKKLLDKYKLLKSNKPEKKSTSDKTAKEEIIVVEEELEYDEEEYENPMDDELLLKDIEYVEEIIEESED